MARTQLVPTSVRLLPEVRDALEAVAADRARSRDAAIRDLLDGYVSTQLSLDPGDRLTHVTSVLRFPPLPAGRYRPDGRVRVPARLPIGIADAIVPLTLRLPGQSPRRGLKDYARSPLSEAITTAVVRERPVAVVGLEDLPAVWTQSAAVGLWRLTVAATLTVPEQLAVLGLLSGIDVELESPTELAQLLRDGDLAWHHPWRYEVALAIARSLLTGPNRIQNWSSLKNRDAGFQNLRFDLERTEDLNHDVLKDAPRGARSDVTSRGGSLVWRARRSLALKAIRSWAVSKPFAPMIVSPPYARIACPEAWTSVRVDSQDQLPDSVLADERQGKVLVFSADGHTAAWPYLRETGEPVPQFDIVVKELEPRSPEEILELVVLDDPRVANVYLEPTRAHELGFIDAYQRDSLIRDAAAKTTVRIEETLKLAEHWTPESLAELIAARDHPARFFEIATEHHHLKQGAVHPWWVWEAGSTVTELEALAEAPERLRELVRSRGRNWKRQLEASMQAAGRAAIARGYAESEERRLADEAAWGEIDDDEVEFDLGDLLD